MSGRKTDYFGTFLESFKANTAPSTSVGSTVPRSVTPAEPTTEREPPMDAVLKIWPRDTDATVSVVEIAKTFGVSLTMAASVLRSMADVGLVSNRGGSFTLTELGQQATTLTK